MEMIVDMVLEMWTWLWRRGNGLEHGYGDMEMDMDIDRETDTEMVNIKNQISVTSVILYFIRHTVLQDLYSILY